MNQALCDALGIKDHEEWLSILKTRGDKFGELCTKVRNNVYSSHSFTGQTNTCCGAAELSNTSAVAAHLDTLRFLACSTVSLCVYYGVNPEIRAALLKYGWRDTGVTWINRIHNSTVYLLVYERTPEENGYWGAPPKKKDLSDLKVETASMIF